MCQYKTLYHDDKIGYAIWCCKCERIQLAYHHLVITFDREDFHHFHEWIRQVRDEQVPQPDPMIRNIVIPIPSPGIRLLLSESELAEFVGVLECTDSELQSLQLIELFNS